MDRVPRCIMQRWRRRRLKRQEQDRQLPALPQRSSSKRCRECFAFLPESWQDKFICSKRCRHATSLLPLPTCHIVNHPSQRCWTPLQCGRRRQWSLYPHITSFVVSLSALIITALHVLQFLELRRHVYRWSALSLEANGTYSLRQNQQHQRHVQQHQFDE